MRHQIENGSLDLRFNTIKIDGATYSSLRIASIKSDAIRITYFHTGQKIPLYDSTRFSIEEVNLIAGRVTRLSEPCQCSTPGCKVEMERIEIYDALVIG